IDLVELYWMISGYGGETAGSIAQKLKINKAVSVSDPQGKIQAQQVTLNVSERLLWLKMLRRDIYHLGMAVDTDDETFGTAPSGVALKFRYTQLDMKADRMIVKLRLAMKEFFWFLAEDFRRRYGLRFDPALVRFDVNKSMITNDLETVQIINLSKGLLPDPLLLARHPFVDDVNQAMKELRKQKKE
nr:phage portal protein [Oscillospiraceae bacterium]